VKWKFWADLTYQPSPTNGGPEKVIQAYGSQTGVTGILIIDNTGDPRPCSYPWRSYRAYAESIRKTPREAFEIIKERNYHGSPFYAYFSR
jgi:hypothetical protein